MVTESTPTGGSPVERVVSAHTPGPWHIGKKVGRAIYSDCGTPICECDCMDETDGMTPTTRKEIIEQEYANARLIAAAPTMLDALKRVVSDWTHNDGCEFEDGEIPALDTARRAIALAVGANA